MARRVALIRGINVGKARRIRMESLRSIVEAVGGSSVESVGQSGNLVFDSSTKLATLEHAIESGIESAVGFRPRALVLTNATFRRIASDDPFRTKAEEGKHVHVWFLARRAKSADLDAIQALATRTERWQLDAKAFYLHAPDGIGRSKLAEKVESLLGVAATARNGNTIEKLLALL